METDLDFNYEEDFEKGEYEGDEKEEDYSKLLESDVVRKYLAARYHQGKSSAIFIIGLGGTGKSSLSIRLGELTNEDFKKYFKINPRLFIVDSQLEFVKAVRGSKLGDVIVIEEVSVLFPSRRAMSRENVEVAKIFDTIRKKQLVIISNAPLFNSIDSHMRALGDLLIETLFINKKQGVVVAGFHRLQTNPRSSKTYTHTMTRNGYDVQLLFTMKPSKEIWDKYEESKDKFLDDLYERLEHESNKRNTKQLKEMGKLPELIEVEPLTPKELKAYDLRNQGKTLQEIADILGYKNKASSFQILTKIKQKTRIAKENSLV